MQTLTIPYIDLHEERTNENVFFIFFSTVKMARAVTESGYKFPYTHVTIFE